MPVSAQEWRVRTGLYNARKRVRLPSKRKQGFWSRIEKWKSSKWTQHSPNKTQYSTLLTLLNPTLLKGCILLASLLEVVVYFAQTTPRTCNHSIPPATASQPERPHFKEYPGQVQANGIDVTMAILGGSILPLIMITLLLILAEVQRTIYHNVTSKIVVYVDAEKMEVTQSLVKNRAMLHKAILVTLVTTCFTGTILSILLIRAGDVETNPGPETSAEGAAYQFAHQTIVDCGNEIAHGLSQDPKVMATALHSKGFISDEILEQTNSLAETKRDKAGRLHSAILEVVREYPHKYSDFIEILQTDVILYGDLLKTLHEKQQKNLRDGKSKAPQPTSASVAEYAESLKERYRKEPIIQDDPWPPSIGNHYINLALIQHEKDAYRFPYLQEDLLKGKVDQIQEKKKPIDLKGMFKQDKADKAPFKMLMDGAPGVGKTTLCRKICNEWAKGEILQDCQLLVYVPLRVPKLAKATRIEDLFYHDDPDIEAAMIRQVRKHQGAGIVFIFDGYDELSRHEREKESLFLDIFHGKILPKCSAVVCSRPYASERIQRNVYLSRHIEVLGFNKEQIEECIEAGVPDKSKAKSLITDLKNRHELLSLCYIPLNCAILIYVYKVEGYTVPTTITKLFQLFISNTFQRQKDIHGMHKRTWDKHRNTLSQIAFQSLKEDKLAFQEDEVPPEEEARLGLLTATKNFSSHGIEVTYQFIHLTIHEYLAAQWISLSFTEQQQADFLKDYLSDDRFRMVLIFLAGITKLDKQDYRQVLSTQELHIYETENDGKQAHQEIKRFDLLIHLAYESQNPKTCCAVANSIEHKVLKYDGVSGTLDNDFKLNIFGYFIAQSGCTWEIISINISDFNRYQSPSIDLLVTQIQNATPSTCFIRFSIDYDNNKHNSSLPLPRVLWKLFQTLPFRSLQCVTASQSNAICKFSSKKVGLPTCQIIGNLQDMEHISFDDIGLGPAHIGDSIIPLLTHCKRLKTIIFERSTSEYYRVMCPITFRLFVTKGLQSSIATVEMVRSEIGIYNNDDDWFINVNLVNDTVKLLLTYANTLRSLTLFGSFEIDPFCSKRRAQPIQLWEGLYMRENIVLQSLCTNTTLKYLSLNSFFLMVKRPGELSTMLSRNKVLTSLTLTIEQSTTRTLNELAEGMRTNTTLKKLILRLFKLGDRSNLSKPRFHPDIDAINGLLKSLHNHPTLEVLDITCFDNEEKISTTSLAMLLLHNSVLTKVNIETYFPPNQLRSIARCLVLNGYRPEIELEFANNRNRVDNYTCLQTEVNNFKQLIFSALLKLMSRLLLFRVHRQEMFLEYH